jgi:hypothetical protein
MIITHKRHIFGTIYRPYEGYYKVKYRPVNREQKRELGQEMVKVIENLLEIEASFLMWLFKADNDADYNLNYQEHLKMYEDRCLWLKQKYNFKWITIDTYYFENEYKPIEKI